MILFFFNANGNLQSITNKDRLNKTQPIVSIRHGNFIYQCRRKTNGDGKNQRAMRYPLG